VTGTRIAMATRNAGKLAEVRSALAAVVPSIEVLGLDDLPEVPEAAETGATFAENALLKARAVAEAIGLPAIADDSGIVVDVLDGFPGVQSARWAGDSVTDSERNARLIERVRASGRPESEWTARFVCALALVMPGGEAHVFEGTIEGRLVPEPRGRNGFGYDPVFLVPGLGRTTAELTREEKNAISHRGKAVRALAERLPALLR